jgi:UrcA family protein
MTSYTPLLRILAVTIFAALTCSLAAVSFASDRFDVLQVKVKYGDLDVSSASGAAALYKRIQGAAETVCQQLKTPDLYYRKLFYVCMKTAMRNAIRGVNQPVLFGIANAKTETIAPSAILTGNGR